MAGRSGSTTWDGPTALRAGEGTAGIRRPVLHVAHEVWPLVVPKWFEHPMTRDGVRDDAALLVSLVTTETEDLAVGVALATTVKLDPQRRAARWWSS